MEAVEQRMTTPGHPVRDTTTNRAQVRELLERPAVSEVELRHHAEALLQSWEAPGSPSEQKGSLRRLATLGVRLQAVLQAARSSSLITDWELQSELLKNRRTLEAIFTGCLECLKSLEALPSIHAPARGAPRTLDVAEAYLSVTHGVWSEDSFSLYLRQIGQKVVLTFDEIETLPQVLKFAILNLVIDQAEALFAACSLSDDNSSLASCALHSLLRINQYEWRPLLESVVPFGAVLREDPARAYAAMDDDTRHAYRRRVAHLARHSDFTELQVASAAIELAKHATVDSSDASRQERMRHVGYFLFAEGLPALKRRIACHGRPGERARDFLRRYNEDFYLIGIMVLTLLLIIRLLPRWCLITTSGL